MIAPACSAAFPTIGSKIMLRKLMGIPQEMEAACLKRFGVKTLIGCINKWQVHIRWMQNEV